MALAQTNFLLEVLLSLGLCGVTSRGSESFDVVCYVTQPHAIKPVQSIQTRLDFRVC